jgi:serine/threonine protein kinase
MANLEGQTLKGRYRIEELVGQGGMAEVYKAWDARRSYYVAIKVIRPDLAADRAFLQRFRREAVVLENLRHPNIMRYYGFEEEGQIAFLVMEYVEGESLRRQLVSRSEPFSLSEALPILKPVCVALHYAHEEGVYHCDVKPANVLIEGNGRVVVSDFGIARLAGASAMPGSVLGAPAYMSPEQCSGGSVDRRADIYALGLTVYEMLTLARPFRGETTATPGSTAERIRWEHMHQSPPSPRTTNPAVPVAVERAVLRALTKDPAARQPTALAFLHDLEVQASVPPVVEARPKARAPRKPRKPPRRAPQPQAQLYVLRGELAGYTFEIGPQGLSIGRSSRNHVRLTQRSVSRNHAILRAARGRFYLQDCGSRHGTYLNGRRIEATELRNGDRITIGDTEMEFRLR